MNTEIQHRDVQTRTSETERGHMRPPLVLWLSNAIVFISSACTMVLELVAGRIMAPYIGVSLYTWTSIIGVVLAGISLGNYLGGKIADRYPYRRTLGVLFFISSLSTLGILATSLLLQHLDVLPKMSLEWRIVMLTVVMFFVPSTALGTVSPVVVKLTLRTLAEAGNQVGRIYAFGALGSIVGTFLTGFWLIASFGTRRIVFAVAMLLLLMAFAVGDVWRKRYAQAQVGLVALALCATLLDLGAFHITLGRLLIQGNAANLQTRVLLSDVAALSVIVWLIWLGWQKFRGRQSWATLRPLLSVALAALAFTGGWRWLADHGRFEAPCNRETSYYCIRVDDQTSGGGQVVKRLVLDHLIHSFSSLDDPTYLQYGYETVYAEMTDFHAQLRGSNTLNALFIGGGGYTYPRYIEAVYPGSSIEVLEIDPEVTLTAYQQLGLKRGGSIHTLNGDARSSLQSMPRTHQYDLIFGDAYNDLSVPYHLTTREFDVLVHEALRADGYYMANLIDNYQHGQFLKAFARTLRQVFSHVYLLSNGNSWTMDAQNTYIVVGTDQPFNYVEFTKAVGDGRRGMVSTHRYEPDQFERDLQADSAIVLTDDYAPVDNLIAPLFAQRGF